jgi:hypothetical protein
MFSNANVTGFVAAALNIYGDTNGDGVVNDADLRADAGADRTVECSAALTPVTLSADVTGVPAGATPTFSWTGPFETLTNQTEIVHLPLGTHTISLTVGAASGVSVRDEVVIVVGDTTAPIPGNVIDHTIEATAVDGTPFTLVADGSDRCGPVTTHLSPALTVYPLGATEVTVTTTDASGNSVNGTVTVIVVDTTSPAVTPPTNIVAEATAPLSPLAIGAASATDIFAVAVTSDAPAAFPVGVTTVTWTATDANGNAASASHTVTVVDTTAPVLTLPAIIIADATSPAGAMIDYVVGASDVAGAASVTCSPASGTVFPAGTTRVACTATDAVGNQGTGGFEVTVRSARDQIVALIELLRRTPLPADRKATLVTILDAILADPRKVARTCDLLRVFIQVVEFQAGRSIPPAHALQIVAAAIRIRAALGC